MTLRFTNLRLSDHKAEETDDEFHFMWVYRQLCRILMLGLITFSLHLQDAFLSERWMEMWGLIANVVCSSESVFH